MKTQKFHIAGTTFRDQNVIKHVADILNTKENRSLKVPYENPALKLMIEENEYDESGLSVSVNVFMKELGSFQPIGYLRKNEHYIYRELVAFGASKILGFTLELIGYNGEKENPGFIIYVHYED